jgi:hypothetical protein
MKSDALHMKGDVIGWSYDQKTPWVNKIKKTLSKEAYPVVDKESSVLANLNRSIGSLISVYKNDEPWWSVNLSQSLYVHTPVVTDWRYTSYLGDSWSVLAQSIEDMSTNDRLALSITQKRFYLESIDTYDDVLKSVSSIVFSSK